MRIPSVFRGLPRVFWILWISTLVDRLGGFAFPFLAIYLTGERGLRVDEATGILSLGGAGALVGSFLGGILADYLGRKPTMVAAITVAALVLGAMAFMRDPWPIAGLWLAYGFFCGVARPAAAALIADVVPPADRLRAFMLLHWAVNIGFAVAPVIGGLLAHRSFVGLFVADAATTLLTVGLIALWVPDTPPPAQHEPALRGVTRAFRDLPFVAFLLLSFALTCVYVQADGTMPVDMTGKGLSTETYGFAIAVNGVLITLFSPAVSSLLAKADAPRVLAGASLVTGIGFGLNAFVGSGWTYALAIGIWTFGEIAATPASGALVASVAPPEQRGRYSAALNMTYGLSRFIAPPVGGLILARAGSPALWLSCLGLGAAIAAAYVFLGERLRDRLRT